LSKVAVSNIATGSQATVVCESLILNENFQTRPYLNNTYILTVPFIPAGRVLNSLINLLMGVNNNFFNGSLDIDEVWERFINFTNDIDVNENQISSLNFNTDLIGSFSINGGSINGINESNFLIKDIVLAFIVDIVNNHSSALRLLKKQKNFESILISGGISQRLPIIKKLLELKQNNKVNVSQIKEDALNGLRLLSTGKFDIW
jgi:hypothetical protein